MTIRLQPNYKKYLCIYTIVPASRHSSGLVSSEFQLIIWPYTKDYFSESEPTTNWMTNKRWWQKLITYAKLLLARHIPLLSKGLALRFPCCYACVNDDQSSLNVSSFSRHFFLSLLRQRFAVKDLTLTNQKHRCHRQMFSLEQIA